MILRLVKAGIFGVLGVAVASTSAIALDQSLDQEMLNRSLRQEAISGVIPNIEKLIRQGADVNSQAPHGESALEYAIRFGRYKAAMRLIELGANPNSEDDSGLSPLLRAAEECSASRVVDVLIHAGADVNHRDLSGQTPLINAARSNCVRTITVLLARAKDTIEIDAQDDEYETAYDVTNEGMISAMLDMARRYQMSGTYDLPSTVLNPIK
jgi:ankyrin repeat protein